MLTNLSYPEEFTEEVLEIFAIDKKNLTAVNLSVIIEIVCISGKPIGEPIAWRGLIVMNTQKELDLAFQEYREGTFIKN